MSERVDIRDKVTGRALYVEDLPEPPGILFVAAIRSPYSHARVGAIDGSAAEALPGVRAVLHRDTLPLYDLNFEARGDARFATATDNPFITRYKVRYDGDLMGMVAADDLRTARAAANLVQIEFDLLEPVFSAVRALRPDAPLIHEDEETNLAMSQSLEWGDIDAALAQAAHVFQASYTSPTIFHHPMEPTMSVLAHFHDGTLEIWTPTNNPWDIVDAGARLFGLEPEQVRLHVPYVGGNFGAKHLAGEVLVAAALSRKLGRPVKYVATEEESFRVTARHAMTCRAKAGVAADGTLLILDVDLELDTGAYFTGAQVVTQNAVNASWGAYRLANFRVQARTAYTNKVPAAMFRNTGKNQTTFAIDCLMDSFAHALRMNPVEFRLKNALCYGERPPVETWRRDGREGPAEFPPIDTNFTEMVQGALDGIGWDGTASTAGAEAGRFARGRGIAFSLRRGSDVGKANARARLELDGTFTVEHNAPEVGEGAHTMVSVVAAGSLGVPQRLVRVAEPDTQNELAFSGTSSQRTTVQMGTAVRVACERLRSQLAEGAAQAFGGSADEWHLNDQSIQRQGKRIPLPELASVLGPDQLEAVGAYDRGPIANPEYGSHDYWSPGVAAAEVEVDRETGEVRVLRYAAVADAGKVLHYTAARGQIEGGAVMGFGAALTEEVVYGEGQLLNGDAFQYRLPQMRDIPEEFSTTMIERGDGPGPFGSKGIAQTSIPCAAPAIANAIFDAVGARLDSTPLSPEKVLRAMNALEPKS